MEGKSEHLDASRRTSKTSNKTYVAFDLCNFDDIDGSMHRSSFSKSL